MPNETRLCFARTSLSVALVASVLFSGLAIDPVFAQSKDTNDGVTVQKNADGTVEAYDAGETGALEDDGGGGGTYTQQGGDGRIHYKPGTSPYQKKYSDGTTVKRNSDGSIETWDEGETHHYSGGLPSGGGGTHRKVHRKAKSLSHTAKAKTTTTSTAKKKTK